MLSPSNIEYLATDSSAPLTTNGRKCCIECKHFDLCPLIVLWVGETENPSEVHTFYCSEFQKLLKRPPADIMPAASYSKFGKEQIGLE